ncbi:hypothetical protein [Bradyrhizobium retamae]|uniref:hypothetical protein n=1 Tax=Bradyrhizobium retamae TaxID=1300035 RepID=UPI000AB6A556|nr:hypothetical protein [Bradyrhizobium retamae]
MATAKQKAAAKKNIRKARTAWRGMAAQAHARAQPEGRRRDKPGARSSSSFFHIEVRPRREFKTFRTQDIGRKAESNGSPASAAAVPGILRNG